MKFESSENDNIIVRRKVFRVRIEKTPKSRKLIRKTVLVHLSKGDEVKQIHRHRHHSVLCCISTICHPSQSRIINYIRTQNTLLCAGLPLLVVAGRISWGKNANEKRKVWPKCERLNYGCCCRYFCCYSARVGRRHGPWA